MTTDSIRVFIEELIEEELAAALGRTNVGSGAAMVKPSPPTARRPPGRPTPVLD